MKKMILFIVFVMSVVMGNARSIDFDTPIESKKTILQELEEEWRMMYCAHEYRDYSRIA